MEKSMEKQMEKPISNANKAPQFLAAIIACIGSLCLGTAMSWTSPALPHIADCVGMEDCDFSFDDIDGSWIGSLLNLGALPASFAAGYLMSTIGRKWAIIFMTVPFTIGWILILLPYPLDLDNTTGLWLFYIGRFFTGFAGGSYMVLAPLYSTEIAQGSIRGALGSFSGGMLTVGALIDNTVGAFTHWNTLTIIIATIPCLHAICMFFMPESPVYSLSKGREAEARRSLQWLRGRKYDITEEIDQMKINVEHQTEVGRVTLRELFTKPAYAKPTLIMLVLMVLRQTTGVNVVVFYLTDIFNQADTGMSAELQSILVTAVQVLGMIAAILLVDRFGRRTLLITSSISCGVSLMALGTYFYLDENACADDNPMCTSSISEELVKKLNWVPLVSLITFSFGFNIGLGPLPWMMNGEMYSEEAKSTSASLASATNWTTTFLVTKFSINITNAINNSGSYYLFGSVCLIASVFVFLVVPETKGKSVQEMKEYFEGHKKEKHGKNNLALADDTLPPYDPCMDDKNDKDGK